MTGLRPLSREEFERAERLRNPAPESRIEAAKNYGIHLTLLIENLRLTPAEGVQRMERAAADLDRWRGVARKRQ